MVRSVDDQPGLSEQSLLFVLSDPTDELHSRDPFCPTSEFGQFGAITGNHQSTAYLVSDQAPCLQKEIHTLVRHKATERDKERLGRLLSRRTWRNVNPTGDGADVLGIDTDFF